MKMETRRFRTKRARCAAVIILFCIGSAVVGAIWMASGAESYFSLNSPVRPDILVVEGWLRSDGLRAAAEEFKKGGYRYLVTTGGEIGWETGSGNGTYAEKAAHILESYGVQPSRILVTSIGAIEKQRTFMSAVMAARAVREAGIEFPSVNIFTLGPHARRSQLLYKKAFASGTPVGVIAYTPPAYSLQPWWTSPARTKCVVKEILGYPLERLFNSGRTLTGPELLTRAETVGLVPVKGSGLHRPGQATGE
jgi:hypothetical protein